MKSTNIKNYYKNIKKIIYFLLIFSLVFIALLVLSTSLNIPGNFKILTVQSGSMQPSIAKGSIVVVKPQSKYEIRDVITVSEVNNPKVSVTHRISSIEQLDSKTMYVTKGDANNDIDLEKRQIENIVGKVILTIPFLGYLINFAKTREGFLILVILPSILIIVSELLSIRKESIKLIDERKKRKLTISEKVVVEIGKEEIKVENIEKSFLHKFKSFFINLFNKPNDHED